MTEAAFLFGTLQCAGLRKIVLGADVVAQPARLEGHVAVNVKDVAGLRADRRQAVTGRLVVLDAAAASRLALYAEVLSLRRACGKITCDGAELSASIYQPAAEGCLAAAAPWSQPEWEARLAAASQGAAHDLFDLARHVQPESLRVRYPMLLAHHASRQRAAQEDQPAQLRRDWTRDAVLSRQKMLPYAYFFGVQVDDLRFARFDGSQSAVARRAGFVMSDAVTVLPYDPASDRVLIIEQFRYGPYLRGDANCWSLEPIAGRVDPGETPRQTALRETWEEARLSLRDDQLVALGKSYPSPGAVSELLYGFVALCDLQGFAAGTAGLESEQEDIRAHVISFARLMELIATGEVQNGPLIQSAYWLGLNRTGLRLSGG